MEPYVPKKKEFLKSLAADIYEGKVFTSFNIPPEDVGMCRQLFMPLMFLKEEEFDQLEQDEIHMFYEYMANALPREVNGYPCFFSVRVLNLDDTKYVFEQYEILKKMREEFMDDSGVNSNQ